jgi:CrcB protein
MWDVLWVGLAGSLGAGLRFVVDGAVARRLVHRVPVGTLLVNITGSLLLGLLTGLVLFHGAPSALVLVAGSGFCGGYTTFSAASFEAVRHLQEGRFGTCMLTAGAHLGGCLAASSIGLLLAAA